MDDQTFLNIAIDASNMAGVVAAVFSLLLLGKSLLDFSQTGPQMRQEVLAHYHLYLTFSLARLTLATFLLSLTLALPGVVVYLMGKVILDLPYSNLAAATASLVSIGTLSVLQFCRVLHLSPGVIVASLHYSPNRLYPLWEHLSSRRLQWATRLLLGAYAVWVVLGVSALLRQGESVAALAVVAFHALTLLILQLFVKDSEPRPLEPKANESEAQADRLNVLMIGSDTLRADRLGFAGYRRALTPNLDRLAKRGAALTQCYVPCARTAPSLLSLLTGTWPHSHGIRDNFVADEQTPLRHPTLPGLLAAAGYQTAALGDWAASDLGKFDLGFQELDVPTDQWNIRFLLRQGPKDIRLFLSLFSGNPLGKFFLSEIYYLAGIPLTRQIGLRARQALQRLGRGEQPFFLNVFMASTHPPFASEYPYYTLFADPAYRGPSKFAMARLTDPFEIIRRQGEPREEFDLDQILDLYDGCVKSFDDEVGRILDYLEASGLVRNTLVVVYSDHGMEFFEHETWGQGNSAIGDFSARVPIIIAGPTGDAGAALAEGTSAAAANKPSDKGAPSPQPSVVATNLAANISLDGVTRTIDLAPTLLDLLGLPLPATMEGVSLASALRGERLPDLPAFHETGIWLTDLPGMPAGHLHYPNLLELLEIPDKVSGTLAIKPDYHSRLIAAKDRMIRSGRWKLVYQPLEDGYLLRLYDIEHDPGCKQDVIAANPAVAGSLWTQLARWMAPDGILAEKAVRPSPSFAPEGAPTHQSPLVGVALAANPVPIVAGGASGANTLADECPLSKPPVPATTHLAEPNTPGASWAAQLRGGTLRLLRSIDDWAYNQLARRTRVLFVLSDGYGFACQSPVIHALLKNPDILVRTTTDRGQLIDEIEFASEADRVLFTSLNLPTEKARFMKWHMVVDTHMNGFYPARNALRVYMHHGPGFGIMGNKTAIIRQCDIFCGLSETEGAWFERLNPGIFGNKRLFFPSGFPKNDALYRGEYDRQAIFDGLGLPDRKTMLITSHWQEQSTLRRLKDQPFRLLAQAFPEFNVIQTGHPWLWQANRKVPESWQRELLHGIREVVSRHDNSRFVQTSDVESLLAIADLLVGDYSSVMTTYCLLNRPIVFFNDPDFQFSIPELKQVFIDASHCFSRVDDLVPACHAALSNTTMKTEGRARMRDTFYAHEGRSAEYMAEIIEAIGPVCTPGSTGWQRILPLASTPDLARHA